MIKTEARLDVFENLISSMGIDDVYIVQFSNFLCRFLALDAGTITKALEIKGITPP